MKSARLMIVDVVALSILAAACSSDDTETTIFDDTATTESMTESTIVDVAASAGTFETLLAAAEAAGLVETLQGDGPFTVFAPTDAAFGDLVTALSASASSSSAWSLLGVSGAAFAWGLPAIWLIPATVLGFCINWYLIAPRLARASRASGALTLTEFIAGPPGDPARRTMMRLGAAVILFSFTFYIAAQFQAAGKTFASVL